MLNVSNHLSEIKARLKMANEEKSAQFRRQIERNFSGPSKVIEETTQR